MRITQGERESSGEFLMSREFYGVLIGVTTLLVIFLPKSLFLLVILFLCFAISREVSVALGENEVFYFSPLVLLTYYFADPLVFPLIGLLSLYFAYKRWELNSFFKSTFLLFYPALFLVYLIKIKEISTYYLLIFIFGIWINDVFAYYIGKNFGKTPLFPKISPKKTVEGFLGGVLFGSLFFALTLPYGILNSFLLGTFVLTVGVAGDYFKSFIKRQVGIKDFSNVFGEHGGFTDRFDALVFSAPVFYLIMCAGELNCKL
ncbi:phosphatidate cytidylyltransferase [Aquifex aeolicus VF5]|uniref:Phosphatidate cytidylyltransferase n=2 Tax=Aquifex aeolicus TaxID=63363 RepID=CDSA_AQUAE|nr:RecName: Full=Phosphatidate cytidylyltransferase; AltName: Full=CDP-DAG synthase; AltName: Full=CDP-DG synthase; AltName: Full=CDP-diacylglycerol synthase; Short=CDS; AltName: Full=CDP-diglyceride pyrophosphorylase; AltName: Full=CDP-diglyceride synthase; AltName: Full=CTP:phosphatidate cytidylyltransferase [Aquifex aeolicus VF5]AAC07246.1 phosphatidate cytidylyltransferase [Aquifex aeolicus VF5]